MKLSATGTMPCANSPIARRHYRVTWSDALHLHTRALAMGGLPGTLSRHVVQSALARP